jgi:hypothetical protein
LDFSKFPNLKKFGDKEEFVLMKSLKQRNTEVDLSNRAAEMIETKIDFGDELIDMNHYVIDFRLLILSLKLDYMRKLTTHKYVEFNEFDVCAMIEKLNDYNSGKIEDMRVFRALIDNSFTFSKRSFKIQFATFMLFYTIPMILMIYEV